MSRTRTGPYTTEKPHPFRTSWGATPGAPSCGRMSLRWLTTSASRVSVTLRITSSVPKVPSPAAHQTLIPRVSRTRIQASSPAASRRTTSKVNL